MELVTVENKDLISKADKLLNDRKNVHMNCIVCGDKTDRLVVYMPENTHRFGPVDEGMTKLLVYAVCIPCEFTPYYSPRLEQILKLQWH